MTCWRICRSRIRAGAGLAVAGCLVAASARAEEPTLAEAKYYPSELPPDGTRARLLLTGLALTAGWYGAGVGTSYLWSDAPNAKDLRLPVVGPWMALGDVGCGPRESGCSTATVVLRTALAVLSGVGQAGGILALTEGLFLDTGNGVPQPEPASARDAASRAGALSWQAGPLAGPDAFGLEVHGSF